MSGDGKSASTRRKQTPWSVKFGDALASRIIAAGGIGTIAAVLLVVVVLLGTALPLFQSPTVSQWTELDFPEYRHFGIDEHALILWGMTNAGTIEVRCIHDGEILSHHERPTDLEITASHLSIDRTHLVLGLEDGSFQRARLIFEKKLLASTNVPDAVSVSKDQPVQALDGTVYQWFDATGIRSTRLESVTWSEPESIGESPISAIDYLPDESSNRLAQKTQSYLLAICGEELVFADIAGKKNMMTRKIQETVNTERTPLQARDATGPLNIMLANNASHAIVTWRNGTLDRFSLDEGKPLLVESQSAIAGAGELTCAAPLLARQTLLCGTSDGRLLGWMITRPEENTLAQPASDSYQLALAHEIEIGEVPLVSISSSEQSHVAIASDTNNNVALAYITTERLMTVSAADLESPIQAAALDPSGDVMVASTTNSLGLSQADIGYPEASFKGFFQRVWYEGHDRPKYIWQSSAGTEESEIKLSMMPLVFGTMKATVYAMLLSVPLAILAAIYTSEFLSNKARTRVKPVVELMASLPSVVLGYVAALVVASYLQDHLMITLIALIVFPCSLIVAGNLWNLLPLDVLVKYQAWRTPAMFLCLFLAYFISVALGPPVEWAWFDGDIVNWISNDTGSATGGWLILLLPSLALLAAVVVNGPLAEFTRTTAIKNSPKKFALLSLVRLSLIALSVLFVAWGLGAIFNAMGWDPRNSLFTSYQDRNALLVGGALGFCVIPIIYTISDDALQAVPQHLRSASLGCGATPWQTTMRVVIPSAMSGLFSAIMIGLGRAVGETMVVLMAAGNTPLMEWNPFSGFRTLSATLATELPEAAKGSTHFRTLFLAAVLLFCFTLVANTLAELVRIRFRKRASQL